jgi:hypothetical protein
MGIGIRVPSRRSRRFSSPGTAAALAVPVLAALVLAAPAAAFEDPGWEPDTAVPSPESVLGYAPGDAFTPHHRLVAYLETLAGASDRIDLVTYGRTAEGRPLLLLVVSDPRNLADRERLQDGYRKLGDPRTVSEAEAAALAAQLPVAVWLSFNIHGDEASSSEAAMALAYRLAADRSEATARLLESAVVLIDPCLNPDGRDRYVNWFRSVEGSSPDPLAPSREHHQPWPGGRFNHYLFDLNRDWAWLTQPETRARAALYQTWMPQVHVDFHEMWYDETYFFFPPEHPVHPLLKESMGKWGPVFGRGNADAFDARGWRYYTAESFDLYYPGYGDSWPCLHGAIGMTYEQAGHGLAGAALARAPGDTLTLAERAMHHYTAALATVRTAADRREEKLLDFHRFFLPADGEGAVAYVFPPGSDPPRTRELMGLLMAHGVEVDAATEPVKARRLHPYAGDTAPSTLPAGTYVVSARQPLHRFIHAVLEPETALPDTFFYDISAWSLPLAFGIEAYWSEDPVGGATERLNAPPPTNGAVVRSGARYAFLISWERNAAARAAARLLKEGVRLHVAGRAFSAEGTAYPAGSLIAFRSDNDTTLVARLQAAARETGVEIRGVDSGLTESGPDLGSSRVRLLRPPRVALVSGTPVDPTSLGACWFLLDRMYGIPHSLIDLEGGIPASALRDYTVLVFPDDGEGGSGYAASVDSETVGVIREWIRSGGVFVGLAGGAFFAAKDMSGLAATAQAPDADTENLSEEEQEDLDQALRRETRREREHRRLTNTLPGTIFRVRVDPLHPLGFGYSEDLRVLKISNRALELGPPGSNAAWFTDDPKIAGYASPRSVEHLAGRPFLVDEPDGEGHVVLYVEDPNFRLFWYGLNKLFLNSIFFLSEREE